MGSYLDAILAHHRRRAAAEAAAGGADRTEALARSAAPPRPFAAALRDPARVTVIAEVKRRSPSKGAIAPDLDPAALARSYEEGGAACLSVLTDAPHFGGSPADLVAARAASRLPVLRKDFTVCEADVLAARAMGADAVLLIVAALSEQELRRLVAIAGELQMAALVEVHDEAELEAALAAGAQLVGVNRRDLRTFEVDEARAAALAGRIPAGVVSVAESGIEDRAAVDRLEAAGYDAVLVGEALARSPDPARALAVLRGVAREAAPCS